MPSAEMFPIKAPRHIAILGGGPAGLAAGYYAKKHGFSFMILEAEARAGGLCVTTERNGFLFDSGAHRFHDQFPEITEEVRSLLGPGFRRISVPSKIYDRGQFINFPLTPVNLLGRIGRRTFLRAVQEIGSARLRRQQAQPTFLHFAIRTYGRSLAGRFLLNYTEKLWGVSCERLSPRAAGGRLQGLNLKAFLAEAVSLRKRRSPHLEGSFYYPERGIGEITRRLTESCGEENIRTKARITRIYHDDDRIREVEVNGEERVEADEVISTLPLDYLLNILEPRPPSEITEAAGKLRYRSLILAAFFLNKESVTPYATVYFPQSDIPQTRIYEPRNRSRDMSPAGKTSLVAELPCWENDILWSLEEGRLIEMMKSQLVRIGWIRERDILEAMIIKLPYCYPVPELDHEEHIQRVRDYLRRYGNLKLAGRNATFRYEWIHNMMDSGRKIIPEILGFPQRFS